MSAKKMADGSWLMTKELLVSNKLGIHARPAAMFVKIANRFTCNIFVEKDGGEGEWQEHHGTDDVGGRSGSKLTVHAEGNDASQALAELETLLNRKFDED